MIDTRSGWGPLGLLIGCLAGSAALYGVSLSNGFQYDDYHMVVYNPAIRDLTLVPAMLTDTAVFSGTEPVRHWRPLVLAGYALDHAVGGGAAWAYHLTNVLLHGVTAWLVVLLAEAWGLRRAGAWAAGAVFLLAPAHSEAVNYVAARSSLLATLFCTLALYGYARFRADSRSRVRWLVVTYGAWGLGLLSKEIAIVVPALMLAYDVFLSRRRAGSWLALVAPYVPVVAGAVFYLRRGRVADVVASILAGERGRDFWVNTWTQLRVAPRAIALYLWPAELSVHHEVAIAASWKDASVLASAAVLLAVTVALTAAALRTRRSDPAWSPPAMGWWWFLIASLPTSLIPLNIQFQEHRLYFPGVGVAVAMGWGVGQIAAWAAARPRGIRRPIAAVVAAGLVIGWAVVDIRRTALWGDDLALWRDAAAHEPPSAHILNGIGIGYIRAGRNAAALESFQAAMRLNPSYRESFANAGYTLHRLGRTDEALDLYHALVRDSPGEGKYHLMVGGLAHLQGDLTVAEAGYRATIRLNPRFADAHEGLGGVLFQRGAYVESVAAFETAERLGFRHPALRMKLAEAYRAAGRPDRALASAEAAWRDAPTTPGLAALVAELRAEAGRDDE